MTIEIDGIKIELVVPEGHEVVIEGKKIIVRSMWMYQSPFVCAPPSDTGCWPNQFPIVTSSPLPPNTSGYVYSRELGLLSVQ